MSDVITIVNPATETVIKEIPADDGAAVQAKATAARTAQRDWAGWSLPARIGIVQRFRQLLLQRQADLAATLTTETGKPITQAAAEIKATTERIDFFIRHVAQVMAADMPYQQPITVPGMAAVEEVITYEPLGLVAHISVWNYPYFVGSNVFIPALLTGNAVLYKPSEVATLTGLAIANLFYEAGLPEAVFTPVIGAGATGAAC